MQKVLTLYVVIALGGLKSNANWIFVTVISSALSSWVEQ